MRGCWSSSRKMPRRMCTHSLDLGDGKTKATGRLADGLYALRCANVNVANVTCDRSDKPDCVDISMLHTRLGHAPVTVLKHLNVVNDKEVTLNSACEICSQSKQRKLPFSRSCVKTKDIFELLHMDVGGPYRVLFTLWTSIFLDHCR